MYCLVGLHVRYTHSPFEVLERVQQLQMPIAQMFMHDEKGTPIRLSESERKEFTKHNRALLDLLFAHGSYKINCADPQRSYHPALEHEIKLASACGCSHLILHAGSSPDVEKGIDALARLANNFSKKKIELQLVVENSAFGAPSIGGDISHFAKLLEKVDQPDQLLFCIDSAHAHAAGYNLTDKQSDFVNLLETTIGLNRIALIHLNETLVERGSHIDLHAPLCQGAIGIDALRAFALNEKLAKIPLILELPLLTICEEKQALDLVNAWFEQGIKK